MIVPILFLIQILLSGSFYLTRVFVKLATATNRVEAMQKLVFQMLSQANLSRIVTIHQNRLPLPPDQFVEKVYRMLEMENPEMRGRKSGHKMRSLFDFVCCFIPRVD